MVSPQADEVPGALVSIQVELFGVARMAAGRRDVEVAVPKTASPGDVVQALAEACPELVGEVILGDRSALQESYTFNLNGRSFLSDRRLHLKRGDTILLFSSQAGG